MQPTPQDNQLMSKHRILSFKPQLRLEWRGQDGQNETEQPNHSASLGDSITSSTRIRFSVRTGKRPFLARLLPRGSDAILFSPTTFKSQDTRCPTNFPNLCPARGRDRSFDSCELGGWLEPLHGHTWQRICLDHPSCLPTTRRSRCSIPAAAARDSGDCAGSIASTPHPDLSKRCKYLP
jgi:hypothetical protein